MHTVRNQSFINNTIAGYTPLSHSNQSRINQTSTINSYWTMDISNGGIKLINDVISRLKKTERA